jgi:imidazolonepropionase
VQEPLLILNGRLVTVDPDDAPPGPRRRPHLADLGVVERGWIEIVDGRISRLGPGDPPADAAGRRIDVGGRVVMPCLVDCHTHACAAGNRFDEFAMRLAGRTYLEILEAGGGIMSTVRAVRAATPEHLRSELRRRLNEMRRLGTGAVEVKSGYGLDTSTELAMLEAIADVAAEDPLPIVATFLAHAIDPDIPGFVDRVVDETLPAVAAAHPGIACDAYCERGAWTLEDSIRLFERAAQLGMPMRVHLDQFNALGLLPWAIDHGARTVDHLEASTAENLDRLAASKTIAVLLPASGFSLDDRYADARRLVDAGAAIAIASNSNPGSAPGPSLAFAVALACRKMRLTAEEAITAATVNAAHALGLESTCGRLAAGLRADLQILGHTDERALGYEFAGPGPEAVVWGGRWIGLAGPLAEDAV